MPLGRRRFACLALPLLAAACSSPDPVLYTMAMKPGPRPAGRAQVVQLRDIGLAGYLDRREIVRSSDGYRLASLATTGGASRWAACWAACSCIELVPAPARQQDLCRGRRDLGRSQRRRRRQYPAPRCRQRRRRSCCWPRPPSSSTGRTRTAPRDLHDRQAAAGAEHRGPGRGDQRRHGRAGRRHWRCNCCAVPWQAGALTAAHPVDATPSCANVRAAACSRSCRRSSPTALGLRALRHRAAPHPPRSAEPWPGAEHRRTGAVRRAVVGDADEGLDRRHRARDHAVSGPIELVRRGLWPLALAVGFTTALAPLAKFAGTLYVLVGLRLPRPWPNLRGVFRFARAIGLWAMLEVLLLGVFVAYTKLGDLVTIEVGPAVYALGPAHHRHRVGRHRARSRRRVGGDRAPRPDPRADARRARRSTSGPARSGCEACGLVSVPHEHDGHCPRCGSALHERKPDSLGRTWAFVIAARHPLHPGQRTIPVLTVIQLGAGAAQHHPGRRRGAAGFADVSAGDAGVLRQHPGAGVQADRPRHHADGHHAGDHRGRRAASCCASARGSTTSSPGSAAGRWSISSWNRCWARWSSSAPLVTHRARHRRRRLLRRRLLTIFAAEAFDPRLMWDAAARNAHRPLPSGRPYPGIASAPALS